MEERKALRWRPRQSGAGDVVEGPGIASAGDRGPHPQPNIVGLTSWPTLRSDQTWIEAIGPESLVPPNLYEAQLSRRRGR